MFPLRTKTILDGTCHFCCLMIFHHYYHLGMTHSVDLQSHHQVVDPVASYLAWTIDAMQCVVLAADTRLLEYVGQL